MIRVAQLVGVVLAGGSGSRLGRPKGDLVVEGVPLALRAATTLRPMCATVLISVAPGAGNPAPGYAVVPDPEPAGRGPLVGLSAAFAASGKADLVVLACDYPRVDEAVIKALLEAAGERDDLVIATDGRGRDHPLVGLWRRSMERHVSNALVHGFLKVRALLAEVEVRRVHPSDVPRIDLDDALLNLNTRADLDAL